MFEHLDAYEQRNGVPHPMVADAPGLPVGCGVLWGDFVQLHNERGRGADVSLITSRDILDWQELYGIRLAAWEIAAIKAADAAYLTARAG